MRMFTKIGVTAATGALPVLLWAGAAGAQQSPQSPETPQSPQSQNCPPGSQSPQSQCTVPTVATSLPQTTSTGGGNLARTGIDEMLPLALGGVALAGAVAVRGVRRRSAA